MCSTSMDTIFAHFCTWKSHSTYGKPCPRVENGLTRSKNSTEYLNLGFHNSFSKLCYIWWNTGTCGNVFVHFHLWKTLPLTTYPFHTWKGGSSVTTTQLSVISTASNHGYKLPVPTAVKQSVDWLHLDSFPVMENCLPQGPSTHGNVVFLWPPDRF